MSEKNKIYHVVKHDNKLPDQILTVEGVTRQQIRLIPSREQYPLVHNAVFDILLHADGKIEIANCARAYKIVFVPL